ncbi:response regulator transcription factor [Pleionea sp. CnH1-48]|uniref:response regulator transcription factor n=1 Tax=Pleionea sp. CnH1-48 TaxID=2954494 RepID=UPI002096C253|nr:response regulator transcription factor [Pleionea sp. CnH1-48]MCO7224300.1 response regulator transcription factor [Pleionea sp. CnH1-48]
MQNYGNILLVEDDASLASWISDYLLNQGFQVAHCDHGDQVVAQVKKENPDLILLDVMLPGKDGIEICRELRSFYNKPIIMLTAKTEEFDEVVGLEVGANDYVMKPVRPRALLARIKAFLRNQTEHNQPQQNNLLTFGTLKLEEKAKRLTYRDQEVQLSTREFELMWLLASHAGQVLERDHVFKVIKNREYDGVDRTIDALVSGLRKKFNDDSQKPQKIKTIWGKGYLFVADAWDN